MRLLGSGGQAQVWRAIKITEAFGLEMQVALKIMRLDATPNVDVLKLRLLAFREEARLSECLRHSPHFVRVNNAFEDKQHALLGLEMEIVEGLDFFDLLHEHRETRKTPIPWPMALSIAAQLFEGLHHAHTATLHEQPLHLVHRDLKPQNLMLSTHGLVKIIDLGIAKWEQRDQALQTLEAKPKGSFAYMAPEQALYAQTSPQSDIFSASAVLYELLTGQAPFQPTLYHEHLIRLAKLAESPIPSAKQIVDHLPHAISSYLDRLLSPDPTRRPQQALHVRQELESLCRRHEHPLCGPNDIQSWLSSLLRGESRSLSKVSWYGLAAYSDTLAQTPEELASRHKKDTIQDAVWSSPSLSLDTHPPRSPEALALASEASALVSEASALASDASALVSDASALASDASDLALSKAKRPLYPQKIAFVLVVVALLGMAFWGWTFWRNPSDISSVLLVERSSPLPRHQKARDAALPSPLRHKERAILADRPTDRPSLVLDPSNPQDASSAESPRQQRDPVDASSITPDEPPSPIVQLTKRPYLRRIRPPKARPLAKALSHNARTAPSIALSKHSPLVIHPNTAQAPTLRASSPPLRRPLAPTAPIAQKATLIVQISPFPCVLRNQYEDYGKHSQFTLSLEPKRYRFRCIHRQKLFLWTFSVDLSSGGTHRVEKRVEMGQVFIRSKPWSSVLLAPFGEIGQSHTPISLPSGSHNLTLYREGQSTQVRKLAIVISPNQIAQPPFVRW